MINENQLQHLLTQIEAVKIAVVGDFCLDVYWEIDMQGSEMSVETGLPTYPVRKQRYFLGGAGNVVANLAALKVGEVHAFGVVGEDLFASEMIRLCEQLSVKTEGLHVQEKEWDTSVYIKRIVDGKELNRIDFSNFNKISKTITDKLITQLAERIELFDAVIINQQLAHGIHSPYFRKKIVALIERHPAKIFLTDSRDFGNDFHGSIRKINDYEARILCGHKLNPNDEVSKKDAEASARELMQRWGNLLFVTRGEHGILVCDDDEIIEITLPKITGPVDTVGAGDSLLAGLAAALGAGASAEGAGQLGTLVAGVTVQKLFQCGTATPEEILHLHDIQSSKP
ncbi:MAG: hypothetical protein DWQ05_05910 [Calditrichaeota bacterium]|nr:MAG: hypothetical protein DWQ05_05910 [Calditrichota bacterium]